KKNRGKFGSGSDTAPRTNLVISCAGSITTGLATEDVCPSRPDIRPLLPPGRLPWCSRTFFPHAPEGSLVSGKIGRMKIPMCSTRRGSILGWSTDLRRSWWDSSATGLSMTSSTRSERRRLRRWGGDRERGLMSGPNVGLVWNTSDGPLNPTKGEVVSFTFGQAGKIWGGQYSFYKVTTEAKKYHLLGWETILAGRLKIGFAEPLGAEENLPISERLYAGGEKSVRGYARRKLGPLDSRGNPIGGLSLIEGSVELRRPIWGPLGGALFIDFGQVSLRSFDLP